MREQPWNQRRISHRHEHEHRNLLDLFRLAEAWSGTAKKLDASFAPLDDDTSPEDALGRLEHAVEDALRAAAAGKSSGDLTERSIAAGRDAARIRWPEAERLATAIAPADKRPLIVALYHSPLAGRLGPAAFLVRRSLDTEVSLELRNCPHAHPRGSNETPGLRDLLCEQHFEWLRGYFQHLNPTVTPVLERRGPHCVVSW
jgi:hypothetical protein